MPTVADCLRQHGEAYLEQFGDDVPLGHRKVLGLITRCRTGELGATVYQCQDCGRQHWVGRSCGNRHCPTCQHEKTAAWLAKQTDRLLPVHHFLITFTLPSQLRLPVRAHAKAGYQTLFSAGSGTIRELASNPKWLGTSQVGFFGVLHTWGRDPMVYHPHVHFVVPGGGVSEDGSQWLATPENFFFPEACASPIYRGKFRDAWRAAGLPEPEDASVWEKDQWWEVDVKAVGDGRAVLKYLAPYVHRVAISDNRIEHCDAESVRYRYTPGGEKRPRRRTVTGHQFVRGFLQHILPKHFQKVRYYGWMDSKSRFGLDEVRWLVMLFLGWAYWLASRRGTSGESPRTPRLRCSHCGGKLSVLREFNYDCRHLINHPLISRGLAYLDSG